VTTHVLEKLIANSPSKAAVKTSLEVTSRQQHSQQSTRSSGICKPPLSLGHKPHPFRKHTVNFTTTTPTPKITARIMSLSPRRPDRQAQSAYSDSTENDGNSDDVRRRAYDLLNRMGGPDSEEDVKEWPLSPAANKRGVQYSSYQQGATEDQFMSSQGHDGPRSTTTSFTLESGSSSISSIAESLVNCVSGACKLASSEVLSQPASILRTGYHSLRTVVIPEAEERWFSSRSQTTTPYAPVVSGTYQTVDVSQTYRGRYSDSPSG